MGTMAGIGDDGEGLLQDGSLNIFEACLSERGRKAHRKHMPMKYIICLEEMYENPWTSENTSGNVVLAVAENRLSTDLIEKRLFSGLKIVPEDIYVYPPSRGTFRLRETLATYAAKTFMKGFRMEIDNITVMAGCGSILDALLFCIAKEGARVAIPGPSYPAFDNDFKVRCGLSVRSVYLNYENDLAAQLDAAYEKDSFAALVVTNPNNPTGEVIAPNALKSYFEWCCRKGVHLISDEIYANSIFKQAEFVSMANVLADAEPELQERGAALCHVVWGLSKDWGMSGMRIGCLYSRNTALAGALENLGYFAIPSSMAQEAVSQMLGDLDFVLSYIRENTRRLEASYDALTGALERAGIPYTPAVGSILLWVDLRAALPEPSWRAEQQLWEELKDAGVLLVPGETCHAKEPGFFRICYSAAPVDAVLEGIRRIVLHLEKTKAAHSTLEQGIVH